jgi:hypothetical protein
MSGGLSTYLEDHLAGSKIAIDLLARLEEHHPTEPLGLVAAGIRSEIESERVTLTELAHRTGGRPSPVKEAAAWLVAKGSRVKLRLGDLDELGLYEAVETLTLGILGKVALWTALERIAPDDPRLDGMDWRGLIEQARRQHARLDQCRLDLAPAALLGNPAAP